MRRPRLRTHRSDAVDAYRESSPPPESTPWRRAPYAVVDLETTGLDLSRDEIISFSAVPVERGRVVVGRTRTTNVHPSRVPDAASIRIHGLREADLAEAPELDDVLDLMLESLMGRVLVAHVAAVERAFLSRALGRAGVDLREPVLDTAMLVQHVPFDGAEEPSALREDEDGERPPGLTLAAHRLGLPVHRPHTAEGDALTTAQLFIAAAARLDAEEAQTVGSLARLSRLEARAR